MKTLFNVGALRQATSKTRLSATQDLVQRTLAQHGLSANLGDIVKAQPTTPSIPKGAAFLQDTYVCTSGQRMFRTYVPAFAAEGVTAVVVMLHGCTQNALDFAVGTGMNTLAEKHRFVVVYPEQSRGDNAQTCWNWFMGRDQKRGRGEPAILAGITQQVCKDYNISRDQTFVAGLSAGAAMAVILGEAYGDVFAAVGAHSGLPFGAARDVASAFAAMAGNGSAPLRAPSRGAAVPTIVFHGTADTTVHPSNGDAIAHQTAARAGLQTIETATKGQANGRSYRQSQSHETTGQPLGEHWEIDGLGHAWSGGQAAGTCTDPRGPDASAEMIRFFFSLSHKDHSHVTTDF